MEDNEPKINVVAQGKGNCRGCVASIWNGQSQRLTGCTYLGVLANNRKPEVVSLENCRFRIMLTISILSSVAVAYLID